MPRITAVRNHCGTGIGSLKGKRTTMSVLFCKHSGPRIIQMILTGEHEYDESYYGSPVFDLACVEFASHGSCR